MKAPQAQHESPRDREASGEGGSALAALILEPSSPRPDAAIGKLLARALEIYPGDAIARVRYGGGILCPSAPLSQLEPLVGELRAIGVLARLVPAQWLAELPRGQRATCIEISGDTVWVRLPNRRELAIARGELGAIQIHALAPESETSAEPEAGESGDPLRWADATAERGASDMSPRCRLLLERLRATGLAAARFFLTLYAAAPTGPLRLERQSIDYQPLGERKQRHSFDNFLLLAEGLLASLPRALNRERLSRFLQTLDPEDAICFKAEEAQGFDRWIQAWMRLTAQGPEAGAPGGSS